MPVVSPLLLGPAAVNNNAFAVDFLELRNCSQAKALLCLGLHNLLQPVVAETVDISCLHNIQSEESQQSQQGERLCHVVK